MCQFPNPEFRATSLIRTQVPSKVALLVDITSYHNVQLMSHIHIFDTHSKHKRNPIQVTHVCPCFPTFSNRIKHSCLHVTCRHPRFENIPTRLAEELICLTPRFHTLCQSSCWQSRLYTKCSSAFESTPCQPTLASRPSRHLGPWRM